MYTLYMHINRINGKKYIGITSVSTNRRWRDGWGYSPKLPIGRAIEKYGWDNFEHIIIDANLTEQKAKDLESFLIKEWHTQDSQYGYNLCSGGDGIRGFHHSDETKEKLSRSARRRKMSGDRNPNYGHRWTDEMKQAASERMKNMSDETRKKISDAAKRRTGEKNPFYGKAHSPECRQRLSDIAKNRTGERNSNFGRKWTDEMRQAASIRHKESFTEEMRKILSEAAKKRTGENSSFYGKKHTAETKEKLAIAHFKKVCQYDLNGNFVKEHLSIKNAAEECGVSSTAIVACCAGRSKTCKGYKWKYVDV